MHRIQTIVLSQLMECEALRYSQLKPKQMEPSQFMYHLKVLIEGGLVEKWEGQYRLTAEGKQHTDRFDDENQSLRTYPRITVAVLYEHPDKGMLLKKRVHQPGFGLVGFVLFDVPLDFAFPLQGFAERSFAERTGINASLVHRGDGYIRVLNNGALEGNMLTHIFYGTGSEMPRQDEALVWQEAIGESPLFSSTTHVLQLLESRQDYFFFEYETDLAR